MTGLVNQELLLQNEYLAIRGPDYALLQMLLGVQRKLDEPFQ